MAAMTNQSVPTVLQHALALLGAVGAAGPGGADAGELRVQTGLHIRTVYRHLASLRSLGMVVGTGDGTRYRLGPTVASLALNASDQQGFLRKARTFAEDLGRRTREPVHVTVYDQGTAITVATATREATIRAKSPPIVVGSRRPAHASASGKIFLAWSASAFEAYTIRPLQQFTAATITQVETLRRECKVIRERGWSQDREEYLQGVSCVAVPVFGVQGRAVGALVVSTRDGNLSTERCEALLTSLIPAARAFTEAIGGTPR